VREKTAISLAGNKVDIQTPGQHHGSGFTLFELLVVLVVVSLSLAIALPGIGRGLSSGDIEGTARQMLSSMRLARSQAIRQRQPVDFYVDVDRRFYKTGSAGDSRNLPGHSKITLYTARSQMQDDGSGYIRFFPDGSATGGRVTLSMDRSSQLIDVNWLTGGISVNHTVATATEID